MTVKRKYERRNLIYYLKVMEGNKNWLIGNLVDITQAGMMLISKEPNETGINYKIRIILPDQIQGKKELKILAKSVWCKKDINPDFYTTGFEFADISEENINIIQELIENYAFD